MLGVGTSALPWAGVTVITFGGPLLHLKDQL